MTETLNKLQVTTRPNVPKDAIDANVRANAFCVESWHHRPCAIVGGGPGLSDTMILAMQAKHVPIFALNNACAARNLPADYVVIMDARPEMAEMDCVRRDMGSKYLVASQAHPSVYAALRGRDVRQWHAAGSDAVAEMGLPAVAGSGTVLTRAVPIAYEMGHRQFHLFGVDSSYSEDGRHHAYEQKLNDNAKTIEVFTPIKRTRFVTTGALAQQAECCFRQWQQLERFGCEFHVYGDGLLPAMWREMKEAKADLDTHEPDKYRRMWAVPEYRTNSPGDARYDEIMQILGINKGQRIVDFGCGSGKFAARMKQDGYYVKAFDFADNCLDEDARAILADDFKIRNLWQPYGVGLSLAYAGVCTDVMEHIPQQKVDAVLRNIATDVYRCVFTISFQPDQFGAVIGEKLHMTVKPAKWWGEKLKEHFRSVVYKGDGLFVCEN